ncbi:MAG TPA: LuxR C-terminal-related transcriptional regulator [Candidatus Kapabacteria bacterium]|nr:LuxR C-terminal-related transcriptional regulator [Candidatus Kapabacteria bacterium]
MSEYQQIREILEQEYASRRAGDREQSFKLLQRAKRLAIGSKNREWLSEVENSYANFHHRFSDFASELKSRRRSVALLGPNGHSLKLSVARTNLGGALTSGGKFVEAQKHLYRALDRFTGGLPDHTLRESAKQEEVHWLLHTLYSIANLHQSLRDYEACHEYLRIHRDLEIKFGLPQNPDCIGLEVICTFELGDLDACERHATIQLARSREDTDEKAEAMALSGLALVSLKRGDIERSRRYNNEAMLVAITISDQIRVIELLCNIAELEMHDSNTSAALTVLDQAAHKIEAFPSPDLNERLHRLTSQAFEMRKEYQAALHHYKLATSFKEKMLDAAQQHEVARVRQLRARRAHAEEKKVLLKKLNEVAGDRARPAMVDTQQLLQLAPSLSRTELKVCELLTLGATTKEIAGQLAASRHTIDGHRTAIRKKLGLGPAINLSTWLMRHQMEEMPNSASDR